jgi:hypothetical protein
MEVNFAPDVQQSLSRWHAPPVAGAINWSKTWRRISLTASPSRAKRLTAATTIWKAARSRRFRAKKSLPGSGPRVRFAERSMSERLPISPGAEGDLDPIWNSSRKTVLRQPDPTIDVIETAIEVLVPFPHQGQHGIPKVARHSEVPRSRPLPVRAQIEAAQDFPVRRIAPHAVHSLVHAQRSHGRLLPFQRGSQVPQRLGFPAQTAVCLSQRVSR